MSIYEALNNAREEFHKLEVKKSGENKFAKYKYFELADFVIPALSVFKSHNLCAVVSFDGDLAKMTINHTVDDRSIEITSPMGSAALKGCHEVQNIGAVETYQRRYLWMAALEIVEHDALDSSEGAENPPDPKSPERPHPNSKEGKALKAARREQCPLTGKFLAVFLGVSSEPSSTAEAWREMSEEESQTVWRNLNSQEKETLRKILEDNK